VAEVPESVDVVADARQLGRGLWEGGRLLGGGRRRADDQHERQREGGSDAEGSLERTHAEPPGPAIPSGHRAPVGVDGASAQY
jgi:hypothetical protein